MISLRGSRTSGSSATSAESSGACNAKRDRTQPPFARLPNNTLVFHRSPLFSRLLQHPLLFLLLLLLLFLLFFFVFVFIRVSVLLEQCFPTVRLQPAILLILFVREKCFRTEARKCSRRSIFSNRLLFNQCREIRGVNGCRVRFGRVQIFVRRAMSLSTLDRSTSVKRCSTSLVCIFNRNRSSQNLIDRGSCSVPEFQKRNFPTTVLVFLYEY